MSTQADKEHDENNRADREQRILRVGISAFGACLETLDGK